MLESGEGILEDSPLIAVGDDDKCVYSMDEAGELGFVPNKGSSGRVLKLILDGVRSDMSSLLHEMEGLHKSQLKDLRSIYDISVPIDENTKRVYYNLINDVREHWNRDIDEIERLFEYVVENKLEEREI